MTDRNNGLGALIRAMRKRQYLTQAQLAERCGLERTSITNIEAGNQELRVSTITSIAEALGYQAHVTFRRKR